MNFLWEEDDFWSKVLNILLATALIFLATQTAGGMALAATVGKAEDDRARYGRVMNMYWNYKKSFPKVEDLPAEEALGLWRGGEAVFVDVREAREQAVSTIPGAVRHRDFIKDLDSFKGRTVIVYCTISFRSGRLARRLSRKGIRVINLQGGLLAWLHAGGPVHRDGNPVNRVHVYGRKWNLAPLAVEAVWKDYQLGHPSDMTDAP